MEISAIKEGGGGPTLNGKCAYKFQDFCFPEKQYFSNQLKFVFRYIISRE